MMTEQTMDDLLSAVNKVCDAIEDKGNHPLYHNELLGDLYRDWPVLKHALNDLRGVRKRITNA